MVLRMIPASTFQPEEQTMWQVHAAFRLGDYRTPEFDVTPALCITLVAGLVGLMISTGL
jgi:hypothetical protein